jgi:sec-independent protein translocase protein TatA
MGMWELVLVFFVVLLFFGARRLPALGDSLGKALNNLKRAAGTAVKDEPPSQPKLPDDRGGGGRASGG